MITPETEPTGSLVKPKSKFRALLVLMALLLGPLALVFGFYGEEDLRGAWILSITKAKWEAQGETFDPKAFIPPPIPDEENLGALPIFQLSRDPKSGEMAPMALIDALKPNGAVSDNFFNVPSLISGKSFDSKMEQDRVAALYHKHIPNRGTLDSVDQLNELFPFWQSMVYASSTRPKCLFKLDYITIPFEKRDVFTITGRFMYLGFLGFKHAALCLTSHRASLALDDIRLLFILADGTRKDGSLINDIVAQVINQACLNVIILGISNHSWNDFELGSIQSQLLEVPQLAISKTIIRGELAFETIPVINRFKDHPEEFDNALSSSFLLAEDKNPIVSETFRYWPGGWWDIDLARQIDTSLGQAKSVHPESHSIDVPTIKALQREVTSRQKGWKKWLISSSLAPSPSIARVCSKAQSLLDETIIACALERYHLAHNFYPPTLTELAPFCPKPLPHDVIGGKPYVYKLKPDGTFLLYSIGWNEVDDGGTPSTGQEKGDWVWPGHG